MSESVSFIAERNTFAGSEVEVVNYVMTCNLPENDTTINPETILEQKGMWYVKCSQQPAR